MGITIKKKICKNCKLLKALWSKGLCKPCHQRLHPTYIKKTTTSINKVSKKQQNRLTRYHKIREIYLQAHPICEACKLAKATEIHHKRGRDGENLFNHFLATCRPCHERIENDPIFAKEQGYSETRLANND